MKIKMSLANERGSISWGWLIGLLLLAGAVGAAVMYLPKLKSPVPSRTIVRAKIPHIPPAATRRVPMPKQASTEASAAIQTPSSESEASGAEPSPDQTRTSNQMGAEASQAAAPNPVQGKGGMPPAGAAVDASPKQTVASALDAKPGQAQTQDVQAGHTQVEDRHREEKSPGQDRKTSTAQLSKATASRAAVPAIVPKAPSAPTGTTPKKPAATPAAAPKLQAAARSPEKAEQTVSAKEQNPAKAAAAPSGQSASKETLPAKSAPYTIQFGAYRTKAYAENLMAELGKRGYAPFIYETRDSQNRPMYMVRYGHFETRQEAAERVAEFKNKEKLSPVIAVSGSL